MKRTALPPQLRALLKHIPYVTIATVCSDGQPWSTPVVGRFDEDLNLYWVSAKQSQHSRNIAHEPRIFVVIYDSSVPEGKGLGLYLKMQARLLTSASEVVQAKQTYDTSFFRHDFARHEQFLRDCPQGFYRAEVEEIWYNVDQILDGHFIDARATAIS